MNGPSRCKDEFTLIKKEDDKIYLKREYWSKVDIAPLESSEFCLLTYNETHKIAQFCGPKTREKETKLK